MNPPLPVEDPCEGVQWRDCELSPPVCWQNWEAYVRRKTTYIGEEVKRWMNLKKGTNCERSPPEFGAALIIICKYCYVTKLFQLLFETHFQRLLLFLCQWWMWWWSICHFPIQSYNQMSGCWSVVQMHTWCLYAANLAPLPIDISEMEFIDA